VPGGGLKTTVYYTGIGYDGTALGYDAAGNVNAYEVKVHTSNYRSVSKVTTERYEGYVEKSTSTTSDANGPDDGSSTNRQRLPDWRQRCHRVLAQPQHRQRRYRPCAARHAKRQQALQPDGQRRAARPARCGRR